MICSIANALWLAGCLPDLARFRRATSAAPEEQERVLLRVLRANAETEFGRQHGFSTIRSVAEYRQRVPARTYEEYEPWIGRIAGGACGVLTRERVRLFEPTSGSTGAAKLIPYTASLQAEFNRAIRPWVADLFVRRPDLLNGRAYWSISPAADAPRRTPGGLPIGFEDDASYVGGWQQRMVRAVMAVPPSVRHIRDMDAFRYQTLLSLVRCRDLRLISVWNPTFLSLLVDRLPEWGERLVRDLHGSRRAGELRAALKAATAGERHAALWPKLGVISCWADGNSAGAAGQLARLFPQAQLQSKGLIATEAFVSFPLTGYDGAALAIRSHFLEFAPVNGNGDVVPSRPCLAHEIQPGQRYAVIITTGGGLYRYHLHDIVEVAGRVGQCPTIRFLGRQRHVSDWFGEKLNEAYVARSLREAFDAAGLSPSFAMLACDRSLPVPAYVLYVETGGDETHMPFGSGAGSAETQIQRGSGADPLVGVAERVEADLRRCHHYDYARRLGQLGPVRVFRVSGAGERYLMAAVHSGRRAGDVKLPALDNRDGWTQRFAGGFPDHGGSGGHGTRSTRRHGGMEMDR